MVWVCNLQKETKAYTRGDSKMNLLSPVFNRFKYFILL